MNRACCLLLPLTLFVTSAFADDAADLKAMQGTWVPASAELGGEVFPNEIRQTIKLEMKDDRYTATVGTSLDKGTIKLKSAEKPKQMDIIGEEGPTKGKTIPAIYEFDGEKLRVCYDLNGQGYPEKFETKAGTLLYLVTYERAKK